MISFAYHKQFDEAFDTGERSFAQTYLLYASSGTFHLEVNERCWLLPPHRAALIQAGIPIRIWTSAASTSASVLFSRDCISVPSLHCQVFRVTALITEMTNYATRWNESQAKLDDHSQSFFTALAHVVNEASNLVEDLWFPRAQTAELCRAVEFTLANLGETLNFSDVARAALASERTLSRRFTEEFDMGWSEFVQRARIIKATERLVMSADQIAHIAHDTGFSSASSFSQTFRQMMGETPSRYRERLK
ncbi:AraC family transcriptional regulator [Undibacterium jejuense]|uniref:AraC family transcriptional regulator n=1 Tax=Undibacterium jejuense TaxID=1344949 RepID=A0A923HG02_9BURK|nr:helix-turn-helix transcriptional regulator [Undibacterium jejuense]MBC3863049.1 AraC family transcriptional regulator [Undibacterium jejuense]